MTAALPSGALACGSSLLSAVRARLREARALLPPTPARYRELVSEVALIGSASRGGSSLVAELLRASQSFVHLRGELNPLLVLNGLSFPLSGTGSDTLTAEHAAGCSEDFDEDLAFECGRATSELGGREALQRFTVDLASRLWMQWPNLPITLSEVDECLHATLFQLVKQHAWRPGKFEDAQVFHAAFLSRLRRSQPEVNPYFYDIRRDVLERFHGGTRPAPGPPSSSLIEEPPFITISPWLPADEDALRSRPLLVKTPSNAYRMPFIRSLFPRARVKLVHLTRNVAASVNGLYDGWQYGGFFAHAVPLRLAISGYSDRFPAWGRSWWKFDLAPGWQQMTHASLEEVCLFQWQSAHRALLQASITTDSLRVKFEDIALSRSSRREAVQGILKWCGAKPDISLMKAIDDPPVVMATVKPHYRRWTRRARLLEPLHRREEVATIMRSLGYPKNPLEWG